MERPPGPPADSGEEELPFFRAVRGPSDRGRGRLLGNTQWGAKTLTACKEQTPAYDHMGEFGEGGPSWSSGGSRSPS